MSNTSRPRCRHPGLLRERKGSSKKAGQQVEVPNEFCNKAKDYRRPGIAQLICLLASFANYSRIHQQFAYQCFVEAPSGSIRF
jgi:hypothetical protein